jgi:hypothetical protein
MQLHAIPYEREHIAANAIGGWLHDRERGCGRDRGVDRVATQAQHRQARLRRQRLALCDAAARRKERLGRKIDSHAVPFQVETKD